MLYIAPYLKRQASEPALHAMPGVVREVLSKDGQLQHPAGKRRVVNLWGNFRHGPIEAIFDPFTSYTLQKKYQNFLAFLLQALHALNL